MGMDSQPRKFTSCPVSRLMGVLSGPWTMYILSVLSSGGSARFGELTRKVEGISTKMLTERLRMLQKEGILDRRHDSVVPSQITYSLTERGKELVITLDQLNALAYRWYGPPSDDKTQD